MGARIAEPGSSPLTRGALIDSSSPLLPRRLIPAHAGSTNVRSYYDYPWEAHPRSRGEHPTPHLTTTLAPGSSPLTRGAPFNSIGVITRHRLIPAHAGSTDIGSRGLRLPEAHPRSRGEHRVPSQGQV